LARNRRVTAAPVDLGDVIRTVATDSAGGTVVFFGTVRDKDEGKAVEELEYEVYKEMAEERIRKIEAMVRERWPIEKVSMVHRYGRLKVGEVSVAVAVSSEHRAEAFEACRYAIDMMKQTLPLWKKERSKGKRESWVKGTPIER
jgi:molybdopterin synthase catalytic subunit